MTREEAIDILRCKTWILSEEMWQKAKNMAIKALEQEPCEDCVSRKRLMDNYSKAKTPIGYWKAVDFEVIKNMPSVTPTRKKGKWIMTNNYLTAAYETIDYVKCSCCGEESLEEGDYCPNCGAEMEN